MHIEQTKIILRRAGAEKDQDDEMMGRRAVMSPRQRKRPAPQVRTSHAFESIPYNLFF